MSLTLHATALAGQWEATADEIDIDEPDNSVEIEQAAVASTLRACAGELRRTAEAHA